ncbi:MAG: dihydropteroate synthase [Chloroflexi bacterium]|nr:dihydropteroate synthase [Chloroflexota bacterium]MBL7061112.1 dihydropteroate synthase [Dehalococcoidia bacterium]
METIVSSPTKEVIIGDAQPTVLIGERINPAGKTKLQEALKAGNLDIVRSEALAQVQAGADILDVNVGTFGVNEVTLLPQAVQAVMDTVDIPLCLDSNNPAALEAALKIYKGKPLINSVSGEEHSLTRVLPMVKEYGAAVVGLVQDDDGIPKDAGRRVSIAHKIVERAEAAGIARENIVIDCLAFAVGADTSSGPEVIEAIRRIKAELGVNMTLGASNISFGLPDRGLLNNAFVAMAVAAGITCLITDAAKVRPAIVATDLILGRDRHARRYIEAYRQRQKQ